MKTATATGARLRRFWTPDKPAPAQVGQGPQRASVSGRARTTRTSLERKRSGKRPCSFPLQPQARLRPARPPRPALASTHHRQPELHTEARPHRGGVN
eukprot:543836-Pyramimonas_sp.AAC.1